MNKITMTETETAGASSITYTLTYEFDEHPDFTVIQLMPFVINGCKFTEESE